MKNKKFLNMTLIILAIIALFIAMGMKINKKNKDQNKPIQYKAMTLVNSSGKSYISVDGKVVENDTKKVYVDKKLKVKEIFVKKGDYVEKGQLLMTFDENERNNTVRKIEKEELKLSKLRRNLEVEKKLYERGGSSRNALLELGEEIRTSEISVEEYNEDLIKTIEKIESPVSGTITSLTAEENYSVNTEQPLMEITDLTEIKIILEVPEYDIIDIKLGQKIDIKPEVYEKKKVFSGKVIDISKISKTSTSTSENVVEVEVKPDENIPNIVPGFKVSASIYLDSDEDLNISKTSIMEENDKYFLYVVNNKNIISKRYVEISDVKKGDHITIKSGVSLGEIIITTPNEFLKDGEKINYNLENTVNRRAGQNGANGADRAGGADGMGGSGRSRGN
ncbi:MAG: efflux RND transporter periplasmic adaptor subunit [Fusobacteriaceae bacterium]|jgi:RND family efflux transporter MFP subunit|nr:efflux RND transporter periplasmic adaptor subunit [Fusobacteriaceae bacterium]